MHRKLFELKMQRKLFELKMHRKLFDGRAPRGSAPLLTFVLNTEEAYNAPCYPLTEFNSSSPPAGKGKNNGKVGKGKENKKGRQGRKRKEEGRRLCPTRKRSMAAPLVRSAKKDSHVLLVLSNVYSINLGLDLTKYLQICPSKIIVSAITSMKAPTDMNTNILMSMKAWLAQNTDKR